MVGPAKRVVKAAAVTTPPSEAKRKEKKRPSWNPYLTDGGQYKLSVEEEGRRRREREKCREYAKLRRHTRHKIVTPRSEDEDASQLVSPPRSAETIESVSLRVWRLEEEAEEAVAANAELRRRVTDLTQVVAELQARLENQEAPAVTTPPPPPAEPVPVPEDDKSVELKWTLDAARRALDQDEEENHAKHLEWRASSARLW